MSVKELYHRLMALHTGKEFTAILEEFLNDKPSFGFVALGTQVDDSVENIGLSIVAANQASDPLVCFKELATNAFDAEIDQLATQYGVELASFASPTKAWEGVMDAIDQAGAKLPPDQIIIARCKDEKSSDTSLTLVDKGCGQPNHKVVATFLSLSAGHLNKALLKHTYGSFGQGSSGVHRHSALGYKLIITGTGDGTWSLVIIRQRQDSEQFVLEWLSTDPQSKAVPSFESPSIQTAFTPNGEPWEGQHPDASASDDRQRIDPTIRHGTAVKLYSYVGASRTNAEFTYDLIDPLLDTLPHPICCVELKNKPDPSASDKSAKAKPGRRDGSANSDVRMALGAKHRLRVGRKLPAGATEDGIPDASDLPRASFFEFSIDNPSHDIWSQSARRDKLPEPQARVSVKVEARFIPASRKIGPDKASERDSRVQKFSTNRLFLSYHGQIHHTGVPTLDTSRFLKDSLLMPHAKDEVVLFADISNIGAKYFNSLFMASRDRIANTPFYINLAQGLREAAMEQRDIGLLGKWEEACKKRVRDQLNNGLMEDKGFDGFERARSFAKNRGFSALVKKAQRSLAAEAGNIPKNIAMQRADSFSLSAAEGGIPANVSDSERMAYAASVSRGAALSKASSPPAAQAEKPALDAPAVSKKAAGKKHTIALPLPAPSSSSSPGKNKPKPAQAAGLKILKAEAEETHKSGCIIRKAIGSEDFRIESQFVDEAGLCNYAIGVRKGSEAAIQFEKTGLCVVFTLQQDGREELVHAKVLWEAKQAIKLDNLAARPKPAEDDPAQKISVGIHLCSKDGSMVAGLPTQRLDELQMNSNCACRVHYARTEEDGSHVLAALFNTDHEMIKSIYDDASKSSEFLGRMRDSIGEKIGVAITLRDMRALASSMPHELDKLSDLERSERLETLRAYKPGASEDKISEILQWQEGLEAEGLGLWDLDAMSHAIAIESASSAAPKASAPSKKR